MMMMMIGQLKMQICVKQVNTSEQPDDNSRNNTIVIIKIMFIIPRSRHDNPTLGIHGLPSLFISECVGVVTGYVHSGWLDYASFNEAE